MAERFEFLFYPKIISGKCALEHIPFELDGANVQKPLVIAGKETIGRGLAKALIKAMYDSTVVIGAVYDAVETYAGISQAREAALLFNMRGCDALIALGGGTVVDLAKAVNLLVSEKLDTLQRYNEGAPISRPLKPLIVVPTCGFNGLEITDTMTVDHRRHRSEHLVPEVVVLDPRTTVGCGARCLAESAAISLANAFTVLTDTGPNPMRDAIIHPALSLLSAHLAQGIRHPRNRTACLALANAAVMASAAYSDLRPGMPQLLAEALATTTGHSVGPLMGVLLAACIAAQQKAEAPVREELCLAVSGIEGFSALPDHERPRKGLEMFMNLLGSIKGLSPASLRALHVPAHLLDQAARDAADNSTGRFTQAECRWVLERAWEEKSAWRAFT